MQRNTVQREQILNVVRSADNHPTAEYIYEKVRRQNDKISLGTVYRNLNKLADEGLILKLELSDAPDRFDKTVKNHYHIYCTSCGVFRDIDVRYRDDIDSEAAKLSGYGIESHSIIFKGLCPDCCNNERKN